MDNNMKHDNAIRLAMDLLVVVAIILSIFLYKCFAPEYHMVMNGDNPFKIAMNEQYVDPGVTFTDDNGKAVSPQKQAKLEEAMTTTGLSELNTAVTGDYYITYEYEKQLLTRMVNVF